MKVLLYTKDSVFGKMLFAYTNNQFRGRVDLILATEEEFFYKTAEDTNIELLLIDKSYVCNIKGFEDNSKVRYLVDIMDNDCPKDIYKYQAADDIIADLLSSTDLNFIVDKSRVKYELIAFYSPLGGLGVTTAAIKFCKSCRDNKRKSFYFSLEDVDSTGYYFEVDMDSNMDLVRLDYLLEENIGITIDKYIKRDDKSNIDYLRYPVASHYLYELEFKSLIRIINTLGCTRRYNYIVLDLASNIGLRNLELMSNCDRVVVIEDNGNPLYKYKKLRYDQEIDLYEGRYNASIRDKSLYIDWKSYKEYESAIDILKL